MQEGIVYLNGCFVPESKAMISVFDRGFNGGEGVYEVTRTFGHQPFKLKEHIERLYRSLRYVRIDCGISPAEMEALSVEVLDRNRESLRKDDDFAIWQVISRGVWQSSIGQKASQKPTVAIYCIPVAFDSFALNYTEGVSLMTPSTRRTPPQSLESKAKLTNKWNAVMASYEARQVDPRCTPLMLDIDGNIAETHMGNFFFVSKGCLFTPTDRNVLGGITRSTIILMAKDLGISVIEGNFTQYDVYTADEAFTCSTSPTVGPVRSLNGAMIGNAVPGPLTLRLINAWNEMVGIDIVAQALTHLSGNEKQKALGVWEGLKSKS